MNYSLNMRKTEEIGKSPWAILPSKTEIEMWKLQNCNWNRQHRKFKDTILNHFHFSNVFSLHINGQEEDRIISRIWKMWTTLWRCTCTITNPIPFSCIVDCSNISLILVKQNFTFTTSSWNHDAIFPLQCVIFLYLYIVFIVSRK